VAKPDDHKIWDRRLASIGKAIVAEPAAFDDEGFRHMVAGWKFLERAGSDGDPDSIAVAWTYGGRIDKDMLLERAKIWLKAEPR
jgi:hypothetical protein